MTRTDIINYCVNKFNMQRYLEIGVAHGKNISKIKILYKDGVDSGLERKCDGSGISEIREISSLVNYKMTSDNFFKLINGTNVKYDFIFIDGLHETDQVDRDIKNSLNHLNEHGIIMLHDTLPITIKHQLVPRCQEHWNGDVWKSVVKLRFNRSDLTIFTINTDEGCTIIKKGNQLTYNNVSLEQALKWDYFINNREKLMNIISVEDFKKLNNF